MLWGNVIWCAVREFGVGIGICFAVSAYGDGYRHMCAVSSYRVRYRHMVWDGVRSLRGSGYVVVYRHMVWGIGIWCRVSANIVR